MGLAFDPFAFLCEKDEEESVAAMNGRISEGEFSCRLLILFAFYGGQKSFTVFNYNKGESKNEDRSAPLAQSIFNRALPTVHSALYFQTSWYARKNKTLVYFRHVCCSRQPTRHSLHLSSENL